jgi:hypothetical protein
MSHPKAHVRAHQRKGDDVIIDIGKIVHDQKYNSSRVNLRYLSTDSCREEPKHLHSHTTELVRQANSLIKAGI